MQMKSRNYDDNHGIDLFKKFSFLYKKNRWISLINIHWLECVRKYALTIRQLNHHWKFYILKSWISIIFRLFLYWIFYSPLIVDVLAYSTLAPYRLLYTTCVIDKIKNREETKSDAILVQFLRSFLFSLSHSLSIYIRIWIDLFLLFIFRYNRSIYINDNKRIKSTIHLCTLPKVRYR